MTRSTLGAPETRATEGQTWSAAGYAENAGFVATLGHDVADRLDPQPGEDILDLGCGDGALTVRLADRGARVTGLEPAPDFVRAARRRGLSVLAQDAHTPFGKERFDAVFSNAALHWMRDPGRVFANVFAALRPGGRFVAEQGGFGIVAAVVTALAAAIEAETGAPSPVNPWDFPSPTTQRARLETAGFTVTEIRLIPRPTPLPTGLRGWLTTFAGPFLSPLAAEAAPRVLQQTERRAAALHDPAEGWHADYVRLRFHAVRPTGENS